MFSCLMQAASPLVPPRAYRARRAPVQVALATGWAPPQRHCGAICCQQGILHLLGSRYFHCNGYFIRVNHFFGKDRFFCIAGGGKVFHHALYQLHGAALRGAAELNGGIFLPHHAKPYFSSGAAPGQAKGNVCGKIRCRQHLTEHIGLPPQTSAGPADQMQCIPRHRAQPGFGLGVGLPLPLQAGLAVCKAVPYLQAGTSFAFGSFP